MDGDAQRVFANVSEVREFSRPTSSPLRLLLVNEGSKTLGKNVAEEEGWLISTSLTETVDQHYVLLHLLIQ